MVACLITGHEHRTSQKSIRNHWQWARRQDNLGNCGQQGESFKWFPWWYWGFGGLVGGITWASHIPRREDTSLSIISMSSSVSAPPWRAIIESVAFPPPKKNLMESLDEAVKVSLMELPPVAMVAKVMSRLMPFWLPRVESPLRCGWRRCDWEEPRYPWRGGRGWSEV